MTVSCNFVLYCGGLVYGRAVCRVVYDRIKMNGGGALKNECATLYLNGRVLCTVHKVWGCEESTGQFFVERVRCV